MSRFLGVLSVVVVVILAMAFAAANAGHQVTLNLGLLTLYRVPVTLVAFGGLLVGMLVMFSAGIHTDLKVRKILRERLADEAKKEQVWIDRNQQDLFSREAGSETQSPMEGPRETPPLSAEPEDSPLAAPAETPPEPDPEEPRTE